MKAVKIYSLLILNLIGFSCRRAQDLPPGTAVDSNCSEARTGKVIFQNDTRASLKIRIDVYDLYVASGRTVTSPSLVEGNYSYTAEDQSGNAGGVTIASGNVNITACQIVTQTVKSNIL